jgi:hypothetical protein
MIGRPAGGQAAKIRGVSLMTDKYLQHQPRTIATSALPISGTVPP